MSIRYNNKGRTYYKTSRLTQ